jgi:endonuclease/exonuclease/phosphatase family metal-dependent hydrolase
VIVAGKMDADADADSMRFWTGRHVIEDMSVCYRSAWESAHPGEPLASYIPENPNQVDFDWPFRGIDHVLVRCGASGGPTLIVRSCRRISDQGRTSVSDHYGLLAELARPPTSHGPGSSIR